MNSKYKEHIYVKFYNGELWAFNLKVVVDYYLEVTSNEQVREDRIESWSDLDLIDWCFNNMEWYDVKDKSKLIESNNNYEDMWHGAEDAWIK